MIKIILIISCCWNWSVFAINDWTQEWTQRVSGKRSLEQVEQDLKSSKWYVRAAALVYLEKNHIDLALHHARGLINDPALLVRARAVGVMSKSRAELDQKLLLQQLTAPINYHKNQSLFIRRQIVKNIQPDLLLKQVDLIDQLKSDKDIEIQKYIVGLISKNRARGVKHVN